MKGQSEVGAGTYVVGDFVAQGLPTGVRIELRAGGASTSFQSNARLLHGDLSILIAQISTEESIANSRDFPSKSIISGFVR